MKAGRCSKERGEAALTCTAPVPLRSGDKGQGATAGETHGGRGGEETKTGRGDKERWDGNGRKAAGGRGESGK